MAPFDRPFGEEADTAGPGRFRAWAGRMAQAARDLFWPPVCSVCPRALPLRPGLLDPSAYFCPECLKTLESMPAAVCPVCGRPFYHSESHVCGDCLAEPPPYGRARSALVYSGGVSRSIALLKYSGELHQLRALTALTRKALVAALPLAEAGSGKANYDLIVPMPVSARRLAERGFNQADELARAIYRPWREMIEDRALIRIGHGEARQAVLGGRARRKAIRGCFQVMDSSLVRGGRILLFDDVLTTGATAGEAATVLLKAGAGRVDLATVARTVLSSWR